MPTAPHCLLIASEAADLTRQAEHLAVGDAALRSSFRLEQCFPEQIDARLRDMDPDVLLLTQARFQIELPAALRRWKSLRQDLQVLLLFHRLPHMREIVELMRTGAFDVLELEDGRLSDETLRDLLRNVALRLDEVRASEFEREQARQSLADLGLIGQSLEMQNLFVQIRQAARITTPVLITGPAGSGKRLIAHTIHALSPRNIRPVVTVSCASLSPMLQDAALFGSGRHPETGQRRGSLLDAARRGSILLDEVGEMPYAVQLELLRLLESPETDGAGALDVRFLATTSRRLEEWVELRSFRADLFYRLNVLSLEVPPLRKRAQDVPLLARYFLSRYERENRAFVLTEEATAALCEYEWPGNVAELKGAMEYAAFHSVDAAVARIHLPEAVTGTRLGAGPEGELLATGELNLERLEQHAILRALQVAGFDKAKTARLLGIGKTTMYRKLKAMSARARGARK